MDMFKNAQNLNNFSSSLKTGFFSFLFLCFGVCSFVSLSF